MKFFASGLIQFGDNAYVDTKYMVVPFKNPKIELRKDDFNFFHSQLHINIKMCIRKACSLLGDSATQKFIKDWITKDYSSSDGSLLSP